jgi:hypothetical protein
MNSSDTPIMVGRSVLAGGGMEEAVPSLDMDWDSQMKMSYGQLNVSAEMTRSQKQRVNQASV